MRSRRGRRTRWREFKNEARRWGRGWRCAAHSTTLLSTNKGETRRRWRCQLRRYPVSKGHERTPNYRNLQRGEMRLDESSGKVTNEGARIYRYNSLESEDRRVLRDGCLREGSSFWSACRSRRFKRFNERRKLCLHPSDQWMDHSCGDGQQSLPRRFQTVPPSVRVKA